MTHLLLYLHLYYIVLFRHTTAQVVPIAVAPADQISDEPIKGRNNMLKSTVTESMNLTMGGSSVLPSSSVLPGSLAFSDNNLPPADA